MPDWVQLRLRDPEARRKDAICRHKPPVQKRTISHNPNGSFTIMLRG